MVLRIFFFLLGFGLMVIGCTNMILYLNLTTIGYTIKDYFVFISKSKELFLFVIGFITISLCLFLKRGETYEFYL